MLNYGVQCDCRGPVRYSRIRGYDVSGSNSPDPFDLNGPLEAPPVEQNVNSMKRGRGRPGPSAEEVEALVKETKRFAASINAHVAVENARRRSLVPRERRLIRYADLSIALLGAKSRRPQPWSDLTNGHEYLTPGRMVNAARAARTELEWNDPSFAHLTADGIDDQKRVAAIYDVELRLRVEADACEAQLADAADRLLNRHGRSLAEVRSVLDAAIRGYLRNEDEAKTRAIKRFRDLPPDGT